MKRFKLWHWRKHLRIGDAVIDCQGELKYIKSYIGWGIVYLSDDSTCRIFDCLTQPPRLRSYDDILIGNEIHKREAQK